MNLSSITLPKIGNETEISKWVGLAAPGGAIIISVVIIVLIIWPKFTQILQLRSDNEQLVRRVESLEAKTDKLASLDKGDLDIKLGITEQLLPSDKSVFTLITQIERTSAASGILLNKIDLAPGALKESADNKGASSGAGSTQGDLAPKVQLRVSLTGDYRSFEQFLKNIFSVSRILAVRDLSLSSSTSSEQATQVRVSLVIDAYWQPLPKELNSIESDIEDLTAEESATLEQIRSTGFISAPTIPSVPTGKSDLFSQH